jgi:hypothetical protein
MHLVKKDRITISAFLLIVLAALYITILIKAVPLTVDGDINFDNIILLLLIILWPAIISGLIIISISLISGIKECYHSRILLDNRESKYNRQCFGYSFPILNGMFAFPIWCIAIGFMYFWAWTQIVYVFNSDSSSTVQIISIIAIYLWPLELIGIIWICHIIITTIINRMKNHNLGNI